MRTIQNFTDKMAISLSLLCAIHCLALPLLIVLLPSITALQLYGEDFHLWMLLAVIPTSLRRWLQSAQTLSGAYLGFIRPIVLNLGCRFR